jgi:hypothetical protein
MPPTELAQQLIDLIVGEAANLDEIGHRIVALRIINAMSVWLPHEKQDRIDPATIEPFTDQQARQFGATAMEFGKHAGKRVDEVDLNYLVWLADASRATWRNLTRYLRSPRIAAELEEGEG